MQDLVIRIRVVQRAHNRRVRRLIRQIFVAGGQGRIELGALGIVCRIVVHGPGLVLVVGVVLAVCLYDVGVLRLNSRQLLRVRSRGRQRGLVLIGNFRINDVLISVRVRIIINSLLVFPLALKPVGQAGGLALSVHIGQGVLVVVRVPLAGLPDVVGGPLELGVPVHFGGIQVPVVGRVHLRGLLRHEELGGIDAVHQHIGLAGIGVGGVVEGDGQLFDLRAVVELLHGIDHVELHIL